MMGGMQQQNTMARNMLGGIQQQNPMNQFGGMNGFGGNTFNNQ